MRKLLLVSTCFFALSHTAAAETEWYADSMPNGLSTLTGVFDNNGIGLMFGCTENFFSAGAIFLNLNKKTTYQEPTKINVTTMNNESANLIAELVPSAESNYTFMSSNALDSIATFHLLDTANNKPIQIEMKNDKLSINNKWLVGTKGSSDAVKKFKETCQLINY